MNVIIFYEHLVREWNAVQQLKKALEEKGARVKVYSLIFQRTEAILDSLAHHPDVIYMPWYNLELHEQILSPIVRKNPVVIINQHQEQVGSPASEVQLIPNTEATKNGCYHFAWGKHFENLMLNNGVDASMIRVTGNVRNDAGKSKKPTISKQELAEAYNLDAGKKWILFAENRGWLSQRNSEKTMQELIAMGSTAEQLKASLTYETTGLQMLVDEMWKLDENFAAQYELIYRPHPGTQFEKAIPDCVHVLTDRSIYDWINVVDLFLTCESTSIFEAEMCGVPCATIDHVEKITENKMAGLPDYPRLNSLLDINDEWIAALKEEQQNREPIYQRYIGLVDGKACERTVNETMEILKTPAKPQNLKKSTLYMNLHQLIFEVVTFIMVKAGLLYKLRFPKSAYVEARDIPYSSENKWIHKK
ncbi:MAG: hypothetical protein IKT57_08370 [Clostridia bacterium]|nr:hypothetical protein [Clostridia bacterium]